jgi:hypothetical protein
MRARSAVAVILVGCAACGGGGGGGSGPPATGAVQITNSCSYVIDETYASPSTSSSWGIAQNADPIAPAGSFTLTGLAPGWWDFMAVSIGAYSPYFAYAWDNAISPGTTVYLDAADDDFTGSLNVSNGDVYSITQVYVSVYASGSWGPNQLSAPITPGATWLLYDVPPDLYDVMCVHSDGSSSTGTATVAPFSVTSIACN